nr:unnamed protein product [Callosobruchus chinensis]
MHLYQPTKIGMMFMMLGNA